MENDNQQHTAIQDLGSAKLDPAKIGNEFFGTQQHVYGIVSFFGRKKVSVTAQGMLEIAAYVEHNRPKLEQEAVESIILSPNDRYYVQQSNMGIYLVKERLESGQNRPDDPVVNEYYDSLYQASLFARQLNKDQRQLDRRYGHWMRHTITPETLAYKYRFSTIELPPRPDVALFRFHWHFPGLGSYRSCRQGYCSVSYEDLPPVQEELFQGTMDWLW